LRCQTLREVYDTINEDVDWDRLSYIASSFVAYKRAHGFVDYTDMLTLFLAKKTMPRFKKLYIDEAQDLSQLQWRIVHRLMENSDEVVVAGDDDQAIFRWSGADVDHFIGLRGNVVVLKQSYRIPHAVHS